MHVTRPYYSVVIPWVPPQFRTEWHPTEETGPFNPLVRGAFPTIVEAIFWGRDKLGGTPYSIRKTED